MRPYKSAKKNPQNWIETLRQYRDVTWHDVTKPVFPAELTKMVYFNLSKIFVSYLNVSEVLWRLIKLYLNRLRIEIKNV